MVTTLVQFLQEGLDREASPLFSSSGIRWGKRLKLKCALLSLLLLATAFVYSFFSPYRFFPHFLLSLVYFFSGTPLLIGAIKKALSFSFDIHLLMIVVAYGALVVDQPFEGALLLVLFSLSHALEHGVESKAKGAIRDFYSLFPKSAHVCKENGKTVEKSTKDISVGDMILVKAGEIIPLDGKIVQGSSSIEVSHLTGETAPLQKEKGETVPSGAHVIEGTLILSVTRTGADSTIAQMISLISKAQQSRPVLQNRIASAMSSYAVTIVLLCLGIIFLLPHFTSIPYFTPFGSIYRGLSFLVAVSPCALVIALPISYFSSLSATIREGIFLKKTAVFDALVKCKRIAFDKTGTLTTGKPAFQEIIPLSKKKMLSAAEKSSLLALIASIEKHSLHPLANAIVTFAREKQLTLFPVFDVASTPGKGIKGIVRAERNHCLAIGNRAFLADYFTDHSDDIEWEKMEETSHSFALTTFCVIDDNCFLLSFSESIRPETKKMVQQLQTQFFLSPLIISGDSSKNVKRIAEELGIGEYYAELLPQDKLKKVEEYAKEGLIMVGDGINDAPALSRATVGMVIGKEGETTTSHSADVFLLDNRLDKIPWLMHKARSTQKIIQQNLIFTGLLIFLAGTFSILGAIPLWLSVCLHEGGTLLVGLNSLQLLRRSA